MVACGKDRLLRELDGSPEDSCFGKIEGAATYSEKKVDDRDLTAVTISRYYLIEVFQGDVSTRSRN